jgi:hypothetical protein
MADVGPFTLFSWFLKTLPVWVVLAWGFLSLVRKKAGGLDLRDWVVLAVAFGVSLVALFISTNLRARYLEQVGSAATGVLARKWISEGDDSVTYKIDVQYGGRQDDFEVSEAFWETAQPNAELPVVYDREFPADFVPKIVIDESPQLGLCLGMLGVTGFVLLLSGAWLLMRLVQRFRSV